MKEFTNQEKMDILKSKLEKIKRKHLYDYINNLNLSYSRSVIFCPNKHISHELSDCIEIGIMYIGRISPEDNTLYIILNEEFIKKELEEIEDENIEYSIKLTKKEARFLTNCIEYAISNNSYCSDCNELYEKLSDCINDKESNTTEIKSKYDISTGYYGDKDRYMFINIDINKPLKRNFTIKELMAKLNYEFKTLDIYSARINDNIHIGQRIIATGTKREEIINTVESILEHFIEED